MKRYTIIEYRRAPPAVIKAKALTEFVINSCKLLPKKYRENCTRMKNIKPLKK
jgi:hypothetical protein